MQILEFITEAVEKVKLRKGWTRIFSDTDILPGNYILRGHSVLNDSKFREEILHHFAEPRMLELFHLVEFLPPCELDGWCLDLEPSQKFIDEYCI